MKVLVAENVEGRWTKVAVLRPSSSSLNFTAAISGTLAGVAAKAAIRQFWADSAAREVEVELLSHNFRVTRFA